MPITQFAKVPSPPANPDLKALAKYVGEVANLFAVVSKDLDYLLNGSLDVNNIRANSITADRLTVDELSAISANLGTITAGVINGIQIFGSYIATANGTYPRIEMSSADNAFRAYYDADTYLEIVPNFAGTSPIVNFIGASGAGQIMINGSNEFEIFGAGTLTLSGGDIKLTPGPGKKVKVSSFDIIENSGATGLQSALNLKANGSGVSGTVYVSSTSGGPTDTAISFSNGVRNS